MAVIRLHGAVSNSRPGDRPRGLVAAGLNDGRQHQPCDRLTRLPNADEVEQIARELSELSRDRRDMAFQLINPASAEDVVISRSFPKLEDTMHCEKAHTRRVPARSVKTGTTAPPRRGFCYALPTMKRIEIYHATRYHFGVPVQLGLHSLLLRPREGHDLRIAASKLDIVPSATVTWRRDLYDNVLGVAAFERDSGAQLSIVSRVEVELYETMPLNFVVEPHALHFPFEYTPEEETALRPYLQPVYSSQPRLTAWLAHYRQSSAGSESFAILDGMNRRIHADLEYESRAEAGVLPPAETLRRGKGSCRDMAALMLESCRQLGIASRFVSGYVHGPATEVGGAASHAWAEVYLPGAGWKGFDPTNASVVGPDHIPVAVHHHPEAIPPVAGSFTGPRDLLPTLEVDVQITRLPDPEDNSGG